MTARRRRLALAAGVVSTLVLVAVLGPILWPVSPVAIDLAQVGAPPGPLHPLGTDESGRDVLSRLLAGGRVSLAVALLGMGLAVGIGAAVGIAAGFRGGWIDALLMRLTDAALAVPAIFVAITLLTFAGPSVPALVLVIGGATWMPAARIVRGQLSALRTQPFVEAAQALGAARWTIVRRHLLPHLVPTLLVSATLGVATAILTESALSYLGLGVQPPAASWGNMLSGAQAHASTYPWLAIFPGLMILATVAAVHALGEAMRDAWSLHEPGAP